MLGLWHDHDAYRRFMVGVHDSITEGNHQASTYESSSVTLADVLLEMGVDAADPAVAIAASGLLRVADCSVHPDRIDHFVAAQQEVWSPGMRTAGMVRGWFSRVAATERFLVFSLWPDAATHQAYVDGPFARLRERADATRDLARIDGALVDLESRWSVPGMEPATAQRSRTPSERDG